MARRLQALEAQIRRVFDKLDSDGDGSLSRPEVEAYLRSVVAAGPLAGSNEAYQRVRSMSDEVMSAVDMSQVGGRALGTRDRLGSTARWVSGNSPSTESYAKNWTDRYEAKEHAPRKRPSWRGDTLSLPRNIGEAPKLQMPAATVSVKRHGLKSWNPCFSSQRRQPPMRPSTQLSSIRGSLNASIRVAVNLERPITEQGPVESLGLSRPLQCLWPRALALANQGQPAEAFHLLERTRNLVMGRIPHEMVATITSEMARVALQAAQDMQRPDYMRTQWLRQVTKEASQAIVEFATCPNKRAEQMTALSYLLHAEAGLEAPSLENLMRNAASMLVEDKNLLQDQVSGYEALVKALIHVLYAQGRHVEGAEWKAHAHATLSQCKPLCL